MSARVGGNSNGTYYDADAVPNEPVVEAFGSSGGTLQHPSGFGEEENA
jgi:hypothetical protein